MPSSQLKPATKVVLVLCDPATRLLSDYAHMQATGKEHRPVMKALFGASAAAGADSKLQVNHSEAMVRTGNLDSISVGEAVSIMCLNIKGMYSTHLPSWLHHFTPGIDLQIVDGGNLVRHPWEELGEVQDFLGLPRFFDRSSFFFHKGKGFFCWYRVQFYDTRLRPYCLGSTKGREHHKLPAAAVAAVEQFYRPHSAAAFSMLDRTFRWKGVE